jgi:hypothetical protein
VLMQSLLIGTRRGLWRRYFTGLAAIGISVLAVSGRQLVQIVSRKTLYSFAEVPGWASLGDIFDHQLLQLSVLIVAGAWLVTRMLGLARAPEFQAKACVISGLVFWLFPPLVLFVLSNVLGIGLFVQRYYFWSIIGLAVFLAGSVSQLPHAIRHGALLLILLFSCALSLRDHTGGFREVVGAAQTACAGKLVLFQPGLAEGASREWVERESSYLSAPLIYYPLQSPRRILLLPAWLSAAPNNSWAQQIAESATSHADEVCLLRRRVIGDIRNLEALQSVQLYRRTYEVLLRQGDIELGLFRSDPES